MQGQACGLSPHLSPELVGLSWPQMPCVILCPRDPLIRGDVGKLCNPRNFYTGHRIHQMTSKIPSKYETLMPTPTGRSLGAYCSHSLLPALHQPARLFSPVLQNNLLESISAHIPRCSKTVSSPHLPTEYVHTYTVHFPVQSCLPFIFSCLCPVTEPALLGNHSFCVPTLCCL